MIAADRAAQRKPHPAQGIGGEGRNHDRDDRRRNGDRRRVDEGAPDALGGEHLDIVVESEAGRCFAKDKDTRARACR